MSLFPTFQSTIMAIVLGLFIPLLSSIIPIQSALSKNLVESLNSQRSKTKGSVVTIDENGKMSKVPFLIMGLFGTGAGISIFYLLPTSLLSFNIALLLQIFFMILLGMVAGLTLISVNLQHLFEIFFVKTLLFFEKKSMKLLIIKNLTAHRVSN